MCCLMLGILNTIISLEDTPGSAVYMEASGDLWSTVWFNTHAHQEFTLAPALRSDAACLGNQLVRDEYLRDRRAKSRANHQNGRHMAPAWDISTCGGHLRGSRGLEGRRTTVLSPCARLAGRAPSIAGGRLWLRRGRGRSIVPRWHCPCPALRSAGTPPLQKNTAAPMKTPTSWHVTRPDATADCLETA